MTQLETEKNSPRGSVLAKAILALVVLSAVAVVFLRPVLVRWVRNGELAPELLWAPAGIFFMSLVLYIWTRAKTGEDGSRKSAWLPFQVGFGLVILLLIVPGQLREYRARKTPAPMTETGLNSLAQNQDARIRALVVSAAVCSEASPEQLHTIIKNGLRDSDPLVQEAALKAVEKLTGNRFDRSQSADEAVQRSLDGFLEAANTKGVSEF